MSCKTQLGFVDSISMAVNDVYHAMRHGLGKRDIPNFSFWRMRVDEVLTFIKPVVAQRRASRDDIREAVAEFVALADKAKQGLVYSAAELPSPVDETVFPVLHAYILERSMLVQQGADGVEHYETPLPRPQVMAAFSRCLTQLKAACNTPEKQDWLKGFAPYIVPNQDLWTAEELREVVRRVHNVTQAVRHAAEGEPLPSIPHLFSGIHLPADAASHRSPREAHSLGSSSHHPLLHRLSLRQHLIYPQAFSAFS
ncbi:hypothetical protein JCM11251_003501 [Rhodosporidiobolus azoricus]